MVATTSRDTGGWPPMGPSIALFVAKKFRETKMNQKRPVLIYNMAAECGLGLPRPDARSIALPASSRAQRVLGWLACTVAGAVTGLVRSASATSASVWSLAAAAELHGPRCAADFANVASRSGGAAGAGGRSTPRPYACWARPRGRACHRLPSWSPGISAGNPCV